MNQVFTLDERKIIKPVGHLRDDEQRIVDLYEKIYRENGMIQKVDMQNLDEHMRKQYQSSMGHMWIHWGLMRIVRCIMRSKRVIRIW